MINVSESKKRINMFLPVQLYDRLNLDSKRYGISKTAIVQTVLVNYYRSIDSSHSEAKCSHVSSDA